MDKTSKGFCSIFGLGALLTLVLSVCGGFIGHSVADNPLAAGAFAFGGAICGAMIGVTLTAIAMIVTAIAVYKRQNH